MIRINQIKLPVGHREEELVNKISKVLKINKTSFTYRIAKKSIDARKKPQLFYVYNIDVDCSNEGEVIKKCRDKSVISVKEKKYVMPDLGDIELKKRPVIVGAGPAGLFAAFVLTEAGHCPVLFERGKQVEQRKIDVELFWETGLLDTSSNVQFGEGGAGTFSDGKLNTAVKDPNNRNLFVLETFVRFGAPENILYDGKPHIGTDVLARVIANMRQYLISKGCEFRFESCITDFEISDSRIRAVFCKEERIETDVVVLALGHSARDTFRRLNELHIPMEVKNFAVGFRVEHPQSMIDRVMYGRDNSGLPASPYKVTSNFPNGRGVYSFCMCPGGYVVNSSSEKEATVVNGMSYSGRDGQNANSAIIVSVTPKDFGADDALAGMRYQMQLEKKNYQLASGSIPQQLYGDYCQNLVSSDYGSFCSTTKGRTAFANLRGLMSDDMEESFMAGMNHFSHIVPEFDGKDVILSGMETRTSSPVRINRDEFFESQIAGIYPCGEGAGYAGGITSAAMDGIKVAEAIIKKYKIVY
ncbi:MAG: FAD-dependent oxidoreductase [Agathobacter sp.]|nr:FAD-dependent oxidoreductase [Agathobacter sp.]